MLKKNSGFTLIEIMVVVVIIGVLATLILPRVLGRQDDALKVRAKSDIRTMSSALQLYKLDNYKYPTTDQGLEALVSRPSDDVKNWKKGGYIDRLPTDPWGTPYQYLYPGEKMEFDIWSLGADGQLGGEDINAEMGNWNLDN